MPFLAQDTQTMNWGFRGFTYVFETALFPCLAIAFILLALSIVTWAILFTKFSMVGKANRQNLRFFFAFRKSQSALDPFEAKFTVDGSPLYVIYRTACRGVLFQVLGTHRPEGPLQPLLDEAQPIRPEQMEPVREEMNRSIGEMTVHLERKMAFLGSVIAGAPFLGLLGTLWGIMATFAGIAMSDTAPSIQSVAPGISSALVTSVIALLVATPAMFAYNFIVNRIRTLIQEMHNFAAELSAMFERHFVYYGPVTTSPHQELPSMSSMGSPMQPQIQSPFSQADQPDLYSQGGSDLGPEINPIAERTRQRHR